MSADKCPKCSASIGPSSLDCPMCGIIFSKYKIAQQKKQASEMPTGQSHEIDYKIIGDDMQVVEIELDPGETVIAEAGAMNYMEDDITFSAKMGDGSKPDEGFMGKFLSAGKRTLTGESLFLTHFTNMGGKRRCVAFAAPYPGKIFPIDLSKIMGGLICQKDAFLCAAYGTEIGIDYTKALGPGFFGGEGFILQRLTGNGMAFVQAGGTLIKKKLTDETLRVDTGCIVGFTSGIQYDIERVGDLKSMFFGGEGMFLATLSGKGTVLLQSLPFSRLADRILQNSSTDEVSSTGGGIAGGALMGALGGLIDGD